MQFFAGSGILFFIEIIIRPHLFIQKMCQVIAQMCPKINKIGSIQFESDVSQHIYILPFDGDWLVFNGGITKETSHSWDIAPQRYAYDFVQVDMHGNTYSGPKRDVTSYLCYDKSILSPAEGVVACVNNRNNDSKMYFFCGICVLDRSIKDIYGNYVIIKHEHNEYSVLAHLKKGSILVKVGEKVDAGTEIAKCGNTGNSSEPHLHFQIQKGKSLFFSKGVKIRFTDFSMRALQTVSSNLVTNHSNSELPDNHISSGYIVKPK